MEGANLAHAQDIQILLHGIRVLSECKLAQADVLELIENDIGIIAEVRGIAKGRRYTAAFRDQLKEMIHFRVLAKSKALIDVTPLLLQGRIPESLQNISGDELLVLKASLFYIAVASYKRAGQEFSILLKSLLSFYPGEIPQNRLLQSLLEKTNLLYEGRFYTPALSYVKNANLSLPMSLLRDNTSDDEDSPVVPEMLFSDCSGFVAHIAKRLNPESQWLQKNRFMSWHLSDAYDHMMNRQYGTSNKFYDVAGCIRNLTEYEQKSLNKSIEMLEICEFFRPVFNPLSNILPGDVIIVRNKNDKIEGHVVIVVEQNPYDLGEVIVIELTRADVGGTRHGYNWRKFSLSSPGHGKRCRVLRFKL